MYNQLKTAEENFLCNETHPVPLQIEFIIRVLSQILRLFLVPKSHGNPRACAASRMFGIHIDLCLCFTISPVHFLPGIIKDSYQSVCSAPYCVSQGTCVQYGPDTQGLSCMSPPKWCLQSIQGHIFWIPTSHKWGQFF